MKNIKLNRNEWTYDPNSPLSSRGGFGKVFNGFDSQGKEVAVKRINLSAKDLAHREMRIADVLVGEDYNHIIPVLDAGEDADSGYYYVVMAKAQKSLQDEIDNHVLLNEKDTAAILLKIAKGLQEVSDIVHRDIKPDNILFHEDQWKIADFGIAKFIEESTSMRTLKDCLSPKYAAPEQWNFETTTFSTDIYALGCVGYALLRGKPPFEGPNFKEQHLNETPPDLKNVSAAMESLLLMMLRKDPKTRPKLERVIQRLGSFIENDEQKNDNIVPNPLENADMHVSKAISFQESKKAKNISRMEERKRLSIDAHRILKGLIGNLFDRILNVASNAQRQSPTTIHLGNAVLDIDFLNDIYGDPSSQSPWDMIAGAMINVKQSNPSYIWGSTLWYTNIGVDNNYRWYEVSYMISPMSPRGGPIPFEPFAMSGIIDAQNAASPSISTTQIAYGPKPIDDEDSEAFYLRWEKLLAVAVEGKLERPRYLPIVD